MYILTRALARRHFRSRAWELRAPFSLARVGARFDRGSPGFRGDPGLCPLFVRVAEGGRLS
jgi:hypothetical protein